MILPGGVDAGKAGESLVCVGVRAAAAGCGRAVGPRLAVRRQALM